MTCHKHMSSTQGPQRITCYKKEAEAFVQRLGGFSVSIASNDFIEGKRKTGLGDGSSAGCTGCCNSTASFEFFTAILQTDKERRHSRWFEQGELCSKLVQYIIRLEWTLLFRNLHEFKVERLFGCRSGMDTAVERATIQEQKVMEATNREVFQAFHSGCVHQLQICACQGDAPCD